MRKIFFKPVSVGKTRVEKERVLQKRKLFTTNILYTYYQQKMTNGNFIRLQCTILKNEGVPHG
ncbi:MAG: hypothetical protein GWN31_16310 [Candidatus Thorarchaeota archaeon]|nr:hypothetical protein [Candidatus Thorarchaeota archaeon]